MANIACRAVYDCYGAHEYIALGETEAVEFLLYLYFGKTETNLKAFALRDLGILRTNKNANFGARFVDEFEARACFYYSRMITQLETANATTIASAAARVLDGPACTTQYASDLRGTAAFKTGAFLEKAGETERACQLYRCGASADCNERLARLLYATGHKDDAELLLRRMIDDPMIDDEYTFAIDFNDRKFGGQRSGRCTELLRAATTVTVDDMWRSNPEAGVASNTRRRGFNVFHTENGLWCSLFGLLFWDELFESSQLHSNFDWLPQLRPRNNWPRKL